MGYSGDTSWELLSSILLIFLIVIVVFKVFFHIDLLDDLFKKIKGEDNVENAIAGLKDKPTVTTENSLLGKISDTMYSLLKKNIDVNSFKQLKTINSNKAKKDSFKKQYEELDNYQVSFSCYSIVHLSDSLPVTLTIYNHTAPEKVGVYSPKITDDVHCSACMKAVISCPDFEIPFYETTQIISPNKNTSWNWVLTSKKRGKHKVVVKLYALLEDNDKDRIRKLTRTPILN